MAEYKCVYEDELCQLYLGMEEFGLSFHVNFYSDPTPAHMKHYLSLFQTICEGVKEKGFKELFTEVETYEQYTFAQFFGFEDQTLIVTDGTTEYQLMKLDFSKVQSMKKEL
jgi:hypothetical protein